jgi:hypothetical protein
MERDHDALSVHKIGTVGICGNEKCGLLAQDMGKPAVFLKTMCTPNNSNRSFDKKETLFLIEKPKQPSQCRGYILSNMDSLFPFIKQMTGQLKIPPNAICIIVIQSSDLYFYHIFIDLSTGKTIYTCVVAQNTALSVIKNVAITQDVGVFER